jgi:YihY family inner membrane protein
MEKSRAPIKRTQEARGSFSLGNFLLQVLRGFRRNQGLLLAGAVAYYTLLSLMPMLILTLVGLSHMIEEEKLFQTVATHLEMIIPGYASTLTEQVRAFLAHREVVGALGFLVLLFFSSTAFTVLENAMSVIFYHRVKIKRRHFLVSAVIPYVFIGLLGLGVMLVSFIAGALQTMEKNNLVIFGSRIDLQGTSVAVLYVMGLIGEVFMLTSLYMVMPVGGITFRHALLGGVTATVLWEITRRGLVWYYSTLSLVNVIYGSLGTAIVLLLTIEVAAIILLFGAQVIAEFERSRGIIADDKGCGFQT